jgi:hypothetical protein
MLRCLPEEVRRQARDAYRQFKRDPWYTSLHFRQVHPREPIYSARITKGYRAVGQRDKTGVVWFWVGSHAAYDKLLSQL